MIRLDGLKALITGGSRGIGRSSARLFARAGCDVALTFVRDKESAESVLRDIEKAGRRGLVFRADAGRRDDMEKAVAGTLKEWGGLDILVNNAGIWTYLEMGAMDEAVYRETMAANLDGVFYAVNAAVPAMKSAGRGAVINVTSTAGVRGEAFHSHYAASKGALHALTKSLAVELAPYGIRVNCVAPGWVDTDMSAGSFSDPEFREKVRLSIPLRRIPDPDDIAGPILFLASDMAVHITGETLNVNGGSVLCGG